jgi:hypothetical protein
VRLSLGWRPILFYRRIEVEIEQRITAIVGI